MKKKNKLISFANAQKLMLGSIKKMKKTETINLNVCTNRVLAQNIYSKFMIPEYNNAAVDGFAFNYNNLKKNKEKKLKLVGTSKPGMPFLGNLYQNQTIKIFTGSYLINKNQSTKFDTICMEEDCKILGNYVLFSKIPNKGSNIRLAGEDLKKEKLVFKKGYKIRSVDLSQLSSLGVKKLKVYKKIKVGIFSSGNELISVSSSKKKFHIYDSNKLALLSLFNKIGCNTSDLGIIKDNFEETKKTILNSANDYDLIVTSGGISTSEIDQVGKILSLYGKILFWKVAIKPGRPFAFGKIKNTPFIGLPGNPVATVITFFMLVINYVKKLSGIEKNEILERYLPSDFIMKKKKGRREWLRGTLISKKNALKVKKFHTTGSGIISSLSQSDGIIELKEELTYISKGNLLKFYRYEDMLN